MAEPRFFVTATSVTIADLIELTGAEAGNSFDRSIPVTGAAAIEAARPGEVCFVEKAQYVADLAASSAVACFCPPQLADRIPSTIAALVVKSPASAFATAVDLLYPDAGRPRSFFGEAGVAPGATVHPNARLESGVTIEPGAVVGPDAEIGSGTTIGPSAVVGPSVRIGRDCFVGASVSVVHALIGDRVVIHSGTRIGQDGFGFIPGSAGHRRIAQIGRVIVQDDVEIGANCCIDRGSNRDTVIGQGTKIDNLVQVAHNVVIGRHCLIAGKVGISGSVKIGDFVAIGGGAGISDHVTIGDGAQISASAGLMRDVPAGARWGGIPAAPMREYFRMMKALERLARPPAGEGRNRRPTTTQDEDGEGT